MTQINQQYLHNAILVYQILTLPVQTKELGTGIPGDASSDDSKVDGYDKPGLSIKLGKDWFQTKWLNISIISVKTFIVALLCLLLM